MEFLPSFKKKKQSGYSIKPYNVLAQSICPVSTENRAVLIQPVGHAHTMPPTPPSCWTVLTCNRPMDGEARPPAGATLPEIWSPTWLPHEQLRLRAQGWGAGLGKNWVSREPMKATLCFRRGEKQLATGAQVYAAPRPGREGGVRDRHDRPAETTRTELPSIHH